ncbi:hypothetical protein C8J57DRAFT_1474926 [Mycena rebaudengoi]|nr:hypothetical protein C8J57DRAFT_1474926 [Mycena rebaudengoi]
MSVRMWLNIGVRRVDVVEHWGIHLHVKPSAPAAHACALVQRLSRFTAGNVVPSIPSSFIPEDDGGVAVADAASGVPGDSASSAGPVRALEDPELSMRVTSIGGAVAEVAPPSTRTHRHAIPRSSPCSLMARGVYKRRRQGVMKREEGGLVHQMGIIQKAKMEGMYEGASTRRQRAIYAKFPPGPRGERWEGQEESFGDDPDSRHRREGGQDADAPVVRQQSSRTHVGAVRPVQKHCAQSSSQSEENAKI